MNPDQHASYDSLPAPLSVDGEKGFGRRSQDSPSIFRKRSFIFLLGSSSASVDEFTSASSLGDTDLGVTHTGKNKKSKKVLKAKAAVSTKSKDRTTTAPVSTTKGKKSKSKDRTTTAPVSTESTTTAGPPPAGPLFCFDILSDGQNIPYPCPENFTLTTNCSATCFFNDTMPDTSKIVDICPVSDLNTEACCVPKGSCADFNVSKCSALNLVQITNATCTGATCCVEECCGLPGPPPTICASFLKDDSLTVSFYSLLESFTGSGKFFENGNLNNRQSCDVNSPFDLEAAWRCLACADCPGVNATDQCTAIANCNAVDKPGFDVDLVGDKLRVSNAVVSGQYTSQLHSPYTADGTVGEAGCVPSVNPGAPVPTYWGSVSTSNRLYNSYQYMLDVSVQNNNATNLQVDVTQSDAQSGRQGLLRFKGLDADTVQISFFSVDSNNDFQNYFLKTFPASQTANVVIQQWYVDGPNNDITRAFVDGELVWCGSTWENFYRANNLTLPCVRDLMFRVVGSPPLPPQGSGFLFDNLKLAAGLQHPVNVDLAATCCPADIILN